MHQTLHTPSKLQRRILISATRTHTIQMARRGRTAASAAGLALLCGLALLAAGAAAADDAGATLSNAAADEGPWDPCGGLNSPYKADAAGGECPERFTCVRQDAFYWQCKEDRTIDPALVAAADAAKEKEAKDKAGAAPAGNGTTAAASPEEQQKASGQPASGQPAPAAKMVVEAWAQCGGALGRADGKDEAWPDVACPEGYACVRQDE